jgi:hypothetical protein
MEKMCRKCKDVKPLGEFYKHPQMADGHLNQCKLCKIAYQKRYSQTEAGKASERRRSQKPARKEYIRQNAKKWAEKYPEKRSAHHKLNNAVRDGRIDKPDACSRCGESDSVIHGHHEDYSKPLDVVWLCVSCHGKEHPEADNQMSVFSLA